MDDKIVENVLEETVKTTTNSKLGTGLVITVGTLIVGAMAYGGMKLYKKIKNKDVVVEEETETEE